MLKLLTLAQAAEQLGCSESKVKALIAAGKLPVIDFGGVRRVRRVDLEAFVERLAAGTSFRDEAEGKTPDPAASGRRVRRDASGDVTALQPEAGSTVRDQTRSSA